MIQGNFNLVNNLYKSGYYENAIQVLDNLIQKYPEENPEYILILNGEYLIKINDIDVDIYTEQYVAGQLFYLRYGINTK